MYSFLKKIFFLFLVLSFLGAAGAGAALYWLVAINPGPEIELANIEKTLGRESPVYYRDGYEKVGVLFQDAHRQYLPYNQIPKAFVNAIVAAEDAHFFDHFGIDIPGIARAMLANVKARRVVQGGSTITQQTAKNLFKRESRTVKAKLKELLFALRLEYHYPKEKILEFYVNQFFVSGNGHGLGVAARYYFDKEVSELTLLENAFIAGSVKRPNYYNPFTKSSEEAAEKARRRAATRASYVLRNMRRLGFITTADYGVAQSRDIVFTRGRMSYALNTIMDLVRDGLATPVVTAALEEHGISNVSTSGIKIFTTVDKQLQDQALFALRKELSRLDVRLRGYSRDEVRREYARLDYPGDNLMQQGSFLFGRVESIETDDNGKPQIRVRFDKFRSEGIISKKGMDGILTAFARHSRQRWSEADSNDMKVFLGEFKTGDTIYVSVREIDLSGQPLLDLERFPKMQGGALVLQKGAVLAMAGGMENRYFNRAINARRPMGSIFKPFVFAAALQLGWSSTDLLNNSREVFVFQDMPYFPRPDHLSPFNAVSMSWAGVKSENLAAVWLLYHLADHLSPPRLREVAAYLDLTPRRGDNPESYEHFKRRIRDKYGITVNRQMLLQAAYDKALENLEADFLFEGRGAEYTLLRQLPYGLHFDRFAEELGRTDEDMAEMSRGELKELKLRLEILDKNFLALQGVLESLKQYRTLLEMEDTPVEALDPLAFFDSESGNLDPQGTLWEDSTGQIIFSIRFSVDNPMAAGWNLLSEPDVRERLAAMDNEAVDAFWEAVLLEGHLSVYALQQAAVQMAKESEILFSKKPYSMEVLNSIHDYRVLVGLQYLIGLAKESGVKSALEPVLSFPLGSNVITLIDAVRMYETLVTGTNYTARDQVDDEEGEDSAGEGLAIIGRIETVEGEVIFSRQEGERTPLDSLTAVTVGDILQNTVRHGTGRYARNTVRLVGFGSDRKKLLAKLDLPLPLLGKTGTANQFRNAAFLGYVPVVNVEETRMELDGGYSVGVYVGFDDNYPMEKGTTHVTGAVGALPTWSKIAETAVNLEDPGDQVDIADLSFSGLPLRYPDAGQVFVAVDPQKGGTVIPARGGLRTSVTPTRPSVLTYGHVNSVGHFEPERVFRPYWTSITNQK